MPTTSSFTISYPTSTPDDTTTTLDSSDASLDDFSPIVYPEDLLRPQTYASQPNIVPFMGFYILLPQDSKAVTDDGATLSDPTTQAYLQLRGLDYAAEVDKSLDIKSGSDLQQIVNIFQTAGEKIRVYRRVNLLKKFICLYMPETLNTDLTATYNNLSIGQSLVKTGTAIQLAKDLFKGDIASSIGPTMTNFIASMSEQGGLFGALGTAGKFIQAGQGTAVNPLSEMFFEAMQFRQFTLDFKFVSRNASEAATIREIIQTFRMYMVPEIKKNDVAGLFMSVPGFFQIKYYLMGPDGNISENTNLPKISGCVLTGMTVDNAPEGIAFHKDGMPVLTRVQFYFTELELMHRDRIKQGY